MPEYTLYVDVWLLRLGCNFVFEYLLLWATATITRSRTEPLRLVAGSLVGTLHYLLYLLASLGLIPFYGLLRFLPVVVVMSLAMLFVTFYPLSWRRLLSVAGYFYGIGFVAAGVGMGTAYLFGDAGSPSFTLGTFASTLAILLIAEFGWGIVHERIANRVYRIPIEIRCDGIQVRTTALVDTGNHLKDPLNHHAVIVVDKNALREVLPPELTKIVVDLGEGELSSIDHLAAITQWQTRLRLIPFSALGKNNGLLIGFRPDEVTIEGHSLPGHQPTIAIHPYPLDPDGEYMALVPPVLMENSFHAAEGGEAHAKAAPSDF